MSAAWCSTCKRYARYGSAVHASTASHRATAARRAAVTSGLGSDRGGTPTALYALRQWAHQYDDVDPGNSPEWEAAWRA